GALLSLEARLLQHTAECPRRNVDAWLARYRHDPRLRGVSKLTMTSLEPNLNPPIGLNQADHVSDLHCEKPTTVRRGCLTQVQPLAQDQAQHAEPGPDAVPPARRMLRRAAAAPVVAHRHLDHAPAQAQDLDHHLGRERGVVPPEIAADLVEGVAPDRPVGA